MKVLIADLIVGAPTYHVILAPLFRLYQVLMKSMTPNNLHLQITLNRINVTKPIN